MSARALALALFAVTLCMSWPVAAGDAIEVVQPRADRADFEILLTGIELDRETRAITEMIFRTYAADLTSLAAQVRERADAAGRREVEEALAGRRRIDPAELRRMRADVRRVELDAWTPAFALLEDLILNTQIMVASDEEAYQRLVRQLRRAVLLAPRLEYGSDPAYAGDGVDLIAIFDEAMASGHLGAFDAREVAADLAAYERQLDNLLLADAEEYWRCRLRIAIARIERDDQAVHAEERALMALWQNLWLLNQHYASRLAQRIEAQAGAAARLRWEDHVEKACFPWLFAASRPEQQYRWIAGNRIIESHIKQEAEAVINGYRSEYRQLARTAIDMVLRARLELGIPLSARTDPAALRERQAQDMLRDLLQNSGRRSHQDSEASQALEALLPDGLRAQMRSDIAAAAFGRRR